MTPFEDKLAQFVAALEVRNRAHYAKNMPNCVPTTFRVDVKGRKYVRVVTQGSQDSVYCFVERSTGNILKAAGWERPAPYARGNIFNDNPLQGTNIYGAESIYNGGHRN